MCVEILLFLLVKKQVPPTHFKTHCNLASSVRGVIPLLKILDGGDL